MIFIVKTFLLLQLKARKMPLFFFFYFEGIVFGTEPQRELLFHGGV